MPTRAHWAPNTAGLRRCCTYNRSDSRRPCCAGPLESVVPELLSRKQGVGEAELAHIADSARVENPIQVIHLVLHHARVEIAHRAVDGPALRVDAGVAQVPIARHQTAQTGHGEASLPAFLDVLAERREL